MVTPRTCRKPDLQRTLCLGFRKKCHFLCPLARPLSYQHLYLACQRPGLHAAGGVDGVGDKKNSKLKIPVDLVSEKRSQKKIGPCKCAQDPNCLAKTAPTQVGGRL